MLNRVTLIGRLVADPEVRYIGDGTPIAHFRIAVDRRMKNDQGEREADFFQVTAFRHTAKFVEQYLQKGRLIAVDGRLQQRQWQAQDGTKRSTVEVLAEDVQPLERPRGEGTPDAAEGPAYARSSRASAPAPEPDAFSGTGPNDAVEGDKDPFEAE